MVQTKTLVISCIQNIVTVFIAVTAPIE